MPRLVRLFHKVAPGTAFRTRIVPIIAGYGPAEIPEIA